MDCLATVDEADGLVADGCASDVETDGRASDTDGRASDADDRASPGGCSLSNNVFIASDSPRSFRLIPRGGSLAMIARSICCNDRRISVIASLWSCSEAISIAILI